MKVKQPVLSKNELVQYLKLKDLWTPAVAAALSQAKKSHGNQRRDSGHSYLEQHIYPVVFDLAQNIEIEDKETLLVCGILHDTLEDDPGFTEEICLRQFGKQVAEIVVLLTKPPKDNTQIYDETEKRERNIRQLDRIKQGHSFAKLIKLADRLNNLECSILIKGQPKHERYVSETRDVFLPFAEEVSTYYFEKLKSTLARVK